MVQKMAFRLSMSLVVFAALLGGAVLPVTAAGAPSVQVIDAVPGHTVRLMFDNLPAGVDFAVTMSAGGSGGMGPVVAHVSSADGAEVVDWFEILSDVESSPRIDVRIDNGMGLFATTSFDNTSNFKAPVTALLPATTLNGAGALVTKGTARVLHVERGGTVAVDITNLPDDTHFVVTVGLAGTQGIGGNVVGGLDTGDLPGQEDFATFEIPPSLASEASLDLRLEAPNYVYVVNFKNVDS